MMQWHFDNRFISELPADPVSVNLSRQVRGATWSEVAATPVAKPQLLAWSPEMAQALDINPEDFSSPAFVEDFAQIFAGNRLLPGMKSYATRYGGHQFGNWAGQLGDGRALHLGEVVNKAGQRWDLQLKGAGPTPYSRRADGRAVLRSSLREFLCSEAMFHLGVPTTRALSLVLTGEEVVRDMMYDGNAGPEPGAIVCRVAPSFLRFGHYEILAAQKEPELLEKLVDFTLARDYPEIAGEGQAKRGAWFKEICGRTALMVAHWMRVGFVHGVMNTDNMSILGLTIDYGPYGWVDNLDPGWTPNTTDAQMRRYRYGQQPQIALWNLGCLATALDVILQDKDLLEAGLEHYLQVYTETHQRFSAQKFGFAALGQAEEDLVTRAYRLMGQAEVDMTLFFRALAEISATEPRPETLLPAFYSAEEFAKERENWQNWLNDYTAQLPKQAEALAERRTAMNAVNPIYVLRNYLAQEAIELAEQGDNSRILALQAALRQPYTPKPEYAAFAQKRPDWARFKPGCSMLSCSS
ncbi:MAG: YdiU family protein [Candidatus Sericytochromatia bacterium]